MAKYTYRENDVRIAVNRRATRIIMYVIAGVIVLFLVAVATAKDLDGQGELITQHYVGDDVVCYRTISPGTGVALSCVKR